MQALPRPLSGPFRDNYLGALKRRSGAARVFTNTLPGRIHDAVLVAEALPAARFVLMKRNPDDTALRIFMSKYFTAHPYAYDLESIRAYIRWYGEMIDVLAEKLPGISQIVSYEDLAAKPGAVLEKLAAWIGLPPTTRPLPDLRFDPGCAAPYREWMR
jgi:hypothetical protein